MSLIKNIKDLQISSRKNKDKDAVSTLTMLISRADADRVKYGLKSTDELTDEQTLKIVQAEIKSIEQELSFLKDEGKINTLNNAKQLLSQFVPSELTADELTVLIHSAISMNGVKPNIGDIMKIVPVLHSASGSTKVIPKGLLSQLAKEILSEL